MFARSKVPCVCQFRHTCILHTLLSTRIVSQKLFCTPLSLGFYSGMLHILKETKDSIGKHPESLVYKLIWIFEITLEVCSYIRQSSFCRDREFLFFCTPKMYLNRLIYLLYYSLLQINYKYC